MGKIFAMRLNPQALAAAESRERQRKRFERDALRRHKLAASRSKPGPLIGAIRPPKRHPNLKPGFFESREWMRVRYLALKRHGAQCQCCGATRADGVAMHVDHIKPRSLYPDLALDINNLQVLCARCNLGKSNVDETDWRQHGHC